jgi:hypothetical protein
MPISWQSLTEILGQNDVASDSPGPDVFSQTLQSKPPHTILITCTESCQQAEEYHFVDTFTQVPEITN